jgi:hypothetical protein
MLNETPYISNTHKCHLSLSFQLEDPSHLHLFKLQLSSKVWKALIVLFIVPTSVVLTQTVSASFWLVYSRWFASSKKKKNHADVCCSGCLSPYSVSLLVCSEKLQTYHQLFSQSSYIFMPNLLCLERMYCFQSEHFFHISSNALT